MDLEQDPQFRRWKRLVQRELVPMIERSAYVMSLVPEDGRADAKFAVELGLSIMMNKPIILVVQPGTKIPPKLALVGDRVVEMDPDNMAGTAARIKAVIDELEKTL
jgi:hypothetical protein